MPARITVTAQLESLLNRSKGVTNANRESLLRAEARRKAERQGGDAQAQKAENADKKSLDPPTSRNLFLAASGNEVYDFGRIWFEVTFELPGGLQFRNIRHTFWSGDGQQTGTIGIPESGPEPDIFGSVFAGVIHHIFLPIGNRGCIVLYLDQIRRYNRGFRQVVSDGMGGFAWGAWVDPVILSETKVSYAFRVSQDAVRRIDVPAYMAAADLVTYTLVETPEPPTFFEGWNRIYDVTYTTDVVTAGSLNYPQYRYTDATKGEVLGREYTPSSYFTFGDGDPRVWATRYNPGDWPRSADVRAAIRDAGISDKVKPLLWFDNAFDGPTIETERQGFIYGGPEPEIASNPGITFEEITTADPGSRRAAFKGQPVVSKPAGVTFPVPVYILDWGRPDFCRQRALEIGFTQADLDP